MTAIKLVNEIKHIFLDESNYQLMAMYELTNGNTLMDFELNGYGHVTCEVGSDVIKLSTTRYDLEPQESEVWYKEVEIDRLTHVVRYAISVKYHLTNSF